MRVAVGTDSLASNPDLDVLAEIRFLHRLYPDVPGAVLLRMATLSGAEALGWADQTGSLTPGKSADLVVVPLPDRSDEPHALLLDSDLANSSGPISWELGLLANYKASTQGNDENEEKASIPTTIMATSEGRGLDRWNRRTDATHYDYGRYSCASNGTV